MSGQTATEVDLTRSLQEFKQTVLTQRVTDAASFKAAGEFYNSCLAYKNKVNELWDTEIKNAHELHKSLLRKRDMMLAPAEEAQTHIRAEMKKFTDEQERLRRAAEARLQAEARKKAEDEAIARAAALEAEGRGKQAQAIIEQPIAVPVVELKSTTPAGFGNITRKVWRAQVFDLMALVKAVATREVPPVLVVADMVALNALARAQKDGLNVPGVRAISE